VKKVLVIIAVMHIAPLLYANTAEEHSIAPIELSNKPIDTNLLLLPPADPAALPIHPMTQQVEGQLEKILDDNTHLTHVLHLRMASRIANIIDIGYITRAPRCTKKHTANIFQVELPNKTLYAVNFQHDDLINFGLPESIPVHRPETTGFSGPMTHPDTRILEIGYIKCSLRQKKVLTRHVINMGNIKEANHVSMDQDTIVLNAKALDDSDAMNNREQIPEFELVKLAQKIQTELKPFTNKRLMKFTWAPLSKNGHLGR
jgi:hypothetical protein